ncbi:hypothetical protein [uncultured Draconibacterium sp.]|nr:hypothetical protein [uncultured Draconibacterium sp.]
MKAIIKKYNLGEMTFEVLTSDELMEVRGGGTPKTRDKDIYDFEED